MLQTIADRVEIEALRGEFTDAVMMRDYDRLASLFTPDGAVRMPHLGAEAASRYRRTRDGWRFSERVYELRYLDTTPLAGSAP
jgi:ketosteroid isomerase-like protein